MTYEVDKGMVPPEARRGSGVKYPWEQMEVGDSFFAPADGCSTVALQNRVGGSGITWCRRNRPDLKPLTRTVTENGVEGIRVWFMTREDG